LALDVVPTKQYAANSPWQQLSILAQPDPELPAGHAARTEAAVSQTGLREPPPRHAHAPLPARRPSGAADPGSEPPASPAHSQPGDGVALWADRSTSGRLTFLPFGANMSLEPYLRSPGCGSIMAASYRPTSRAWSRLRPPRSAQIVRVQRG